MKIALVLILPVSIAAADETGPETRTDTAPAMDVASATETRIYTMELPDRGPLTLTIPSRWRESPGPSIGNCPTVIFAPPSGDDFQTLVTPLWSGTGDPSFNRPEIVKAAMEAELRRMLPTAVERQVPLEGFQGVDGPGYYFLVTDRAPKPGEYPYAVRAGVGVGDLWLSVTVLARSKQTPGIADTIRALASARQLPE